MFFIFGMPKSGTTLLAQCLSAHPDIVVPDETDFIIPMAFIFDRVSNEEVGRELTYKLIINTAAFSHSLGEYLEAHTVREILYSCEYSPSSVLNGLYEKIAEVGNATLAGDKSPNDLNFLRMLVKTGGISPETMVIHIVRDIRDVMVSLNKTGWVSDLDLYFPRFWCNNNLYLYSLYHDTESSYMLVRYEDLAANPEREFSRISRFLNVEFCQEMLAPENRHMRYKDSDTHANLYKPISDFAIGQYVTILNHDTKVNYEKQAREALLTFGYLEGSIDE